MVASPHYLATGSGLDALRRGGSAVDAAITTNAVLSVVTPYLCGMGGDLFAQVYDAKARELSGLNGSGRAGREATLEAVRQRAGGYEMPQRGALTVTVPGCVEAWGRLHERFGRLPWRDLFADAIRYAADGFPVSSGFVSTVARILPILHPLTPAIETFLPGDTPLAEGDVFHQPRLARTLTDISEHGPGTLYRGPLADEIVSTLTRLGGLLSLEDLAGHESEWVEPLSIRYRDVDVFELPPNSQGVTALMMLNILQTFPARRPSTDVWLHRLAEIARLAYADREEYITDPDHMTVEADTFLSDEYARERALLVREHAATRWLPGSPGDTAFMCTADSEGNLVSLIESNFMGIGSGVMAGETGIMLHNRGAWFSLEPGHCNAIGPRKRTMHTLMPGMAFKDRKPWLVFGSMGGSAQAQINVQILTNMIDFGMPVDEAINAPRIDAVCGEVNGKPRLAAESRIDDDVLAGLFARGHGVDVLPPYTSEMGHAHAIELLSSGGYVGASDPRCEGLALGY